jgi:hypothetical protein
MLVLGNINITCNKGLKNSNWANASKKQATYNVVCKVFAEIKGTLKNSDNNNLVSNS